jgi:outer membrane immunogenic protein
MVFTNSLVPPGFSTPAFSHGGYFVGGGVEAALAPGWFWRNEYRMAAYGNQVLTETIGGLPISSINFKPTVQTVTSQLIYKFNWTR